MPDLCRRVRFRSWCHRVQRRSTIESPNRDEALHKGGVSTEIGVYTREDEDLVVQDVVPLVLTRTYCLAITSPDSSALGAHIPASGI